LAFPFLLFSAAIIICKRSKNEYNFKIILIYYRDNTEILIGDNGSHGDGYFKIILKYYGKVNLPEVQDTDELCEERYGLLEWLKNSLKPI
jgi:hypothetical protein